jgi:hypothetical protein
MIKLEVVRFRNVNMNRDTGSLFDVCFQLERQVCRQCPSKQQVCGGGEKRVEVQIFAVGT